MRRTISCLTVGAVLLSSGCAWMPPTRIADGMRATDFSYLLTGTNQGITLRPQPTVSKKGINVTYFGSGGALIERGDAAILLAPFMSHHYYFRLGFWKTKPETATINSILQPYKKQLKRVRAVLLGHGHYDHLLDVPELVPKSSPAATVYGSNTVVNTLSPTGLAIQSVSGFAERPGERGRWTVTNDSIRFMAISSDHAPNLLGRTIAKGSTGANWFSCRKNRAAGNWVRPSLT